MQFLGTETPQGTSWTSPAILSNTADTLTGSIFSDQTGTLLVEQSGDGVHWDINDSISVTASTGTKINVTVLNPYVHLKWTSGSGPTIFRLYARASSASVKG